MNVDELRRQEIPFDRPFLTLKPGDHRHLLVKFGGEPSVVVLPAEPAGWTVGDQVILVRAKNAGPLRFAAMGALDNPLRHRQAAHVGAPVIVQVIQPKGPPEVLLLWSLSGATSP